MIIVDTDAAEDLDLGVGTVQKDFQGGGQLNCHQISLSTFSRAGAAGTAVTASWTPGVIAAGSQASTTVTVPGCATGDKVLVSFSALGANPLLISAHVEVSGTVRVVIANLTGSPVTLAAGTLSILAFAHR